ncbi:MAG: STAS domain-containing protein [Magnetococcales bacterium]|nr:STAS domain-containing protein [Magnetococcales bacterium]
MQVQTNSSGTYIITIPVRFTFKEHKIFHSIYCNNKKHSKYILDMKNVTYIDSSALGMIQLLGDHESVAKRQDLKIINTSKNVKKMLHIFQFDKLYTIT